MTSQFMKTYISITHHLPHFSCLNDTGTVFVIQKLPDNNINHSPCHSIRKASLCHHLTRTIPKKKENKKRKITFKSTSSPLSFYFHKFACKTKNDTSTDQ